MYFKRTNKLLIDEKVSGQERKSVKLPSDATKKVNTYLSGIQSGALERHWIVLLLFLKQHYSLIVNKITLEFVSESFFSFILGLF